MKKRLIAYLLFLPIILLMAFTPISVYLPYLGGAAAIGCVLLILYIFFKTRAFYKVKKLLFFAVIAFTAFGGNQLANAQIFGGMLDDSSSPMNYTFGFAATDSTQIPASYTEQPECLDVKNQIDSLREVFSTVGRIPESQRTESQQKKYLEAKKKYEDVIKKCNIQPCPTPKELYEEISSDCWVCDIADLFLEAGDKVATSVYTVVSRDGYALILLALGFFFWLITRTFTLFMSMGVGDIGRYFTDLFQKFLLVGGIAILLSFPIRNTVDFVVSPFFLFSATLSQQIQKITTDMPSYGKMTKIDVLMSDKFGDAMECEYCQNLKNGTNNLPDDRVSNAIKYQASLSERVVSPTMRNSLLCTICSIYRVTVPPSVVGQFLYCSAKQLKTDGTQIGKTKVFTDWDAIIVGFFLTTTFFIISSLFSFYLIDTFFRICIVLILFPFLVVAFAFKSTRCYTKKGLDVLIHSAVTYIIIGLFMALTVQIFYTMLGSVSQQIVDALADEENAYILLKKLLTFSSKNGAWVMFSCLGLVFVVFFILKQLDSYITALTGINLSNGGGAAAVVSSAAVGMAAVGTVSQVYDKEWTSPWWKKALTKGDADNNSESKAAKIRSYGEDASDGKAEKTVDKAANVAEKGIENAGNTVADTVYKAGTKLSKSMIEKGMGLCGKGFFSTILGVILISAGAVLRGGTKIAEKTIKIATKVAAKTTQLAIKYGGRGVVKAAKWPGKAIARNKYFNKTVGLAWQTGSDVKNTTKAAWKYLKGKKK